MMNFSEALHKRYILYDFIYMTFYNRPIMYGRKEKKNNGCLRGVRIDWGKAWGNLLVVGNSFLSL